ncbi:hypothetical protein UVI_02030680 [Ustilaginoidea virens]|uniref:DUF3669 domain-containing protein n=1 Tax=Ustilaginoidea virens TaxID=1159556 RepID=A0A1B5L8E9_USTVR|nr:hypothetical protein UVI_02030680 [Ustilaginoidea virens]
MQREPMVHKDAGKLPGAAAIAAPRMRQNGTGQLWSYISRAWKLRRSATAPDRPSPPGSEQDSQPQPQSQPQSQSQSQPQPRPPSPSQPPPPPEQAQPISWLYETSRPPIVTVKVSSHEKLLQGEYDTHRKIESAFDRVGRGVGRAVVLPYVPRCVTFRPRVHLSQYSERELPRTGLPTYSAAYEMEHIRPFNKDHVNYLVKRHIAHFVQDKALADVVDSRLVVQVCLGDLRPLSDKWQLGLDKRPAYLDQLHQEGVDINGLAEIMGSALAVLHWHCGLDGAGVEFVLGCERKGYIRLWLTSFGACRPFEPTAAQVRTSLVDAIMQNNSCWPRWVNLRPFRHMWCKFRMAYINMALLLDDDCEGKLAEEFLPSIFINELEMARGPSQLVHGRSCGLAEQDDEKRFNDGMMLGDDVTTGTTRQPAT